MTLPGARECQPSIYVIGVPAAGKTTLVTALADHLRNTRPDCRFYVVDEVAREIVLREHVRPQDIQNGKDHTIKLQKTILELQAAREIRTIGDPSIEFCISDRSGIDPIAFTMHYGKPDFAEALLDSEAWNFLRARLQSSLVILCEPQPQWFEEDGVRVVPTSLAETSNLHMTFSGILQAQAIPFEILAASQTDIEDRVQTVMRLWEQKRKSSPPA